MAYNSNELKRTDDFAIPGAAAGANPGFFLHQTADTAAVVIAAGYFNGAADRLTVGSVIVSVTSAGGTPVTTLRTVTANTGSAVTIV